MTQPDALPPGGGEPGERERRARNASAIERAARATVLAATSHMALVIALEAYRDAVRAAALASGSPHEAERALGRQFAAWWKFAAAWPEGTTVIERGSQLAQAAEAVLRGNP